MRGGKEPEILKKLSNEFRLFRILCRASRADAAGNAPDLSNVWKIVVRGLPILGKRPASCWECGVMAGEKKGQNGQSEGLIPKHGGFRKLKSFQIAQLVYDVTVRFCDKYIGKSSRTHDQMVQAARSGVQNIAEGSVASGTSKKMELKLTNVARASLEELRLDYEDFLRQRGLALWPSDDPRRAALVARRCQTADEVARWVKEVAQQEWREMQDEQHGRDGQSTSSIRSIQDLYAQTAANAAHVLVGVAMALLDRQLAAQARAFEREGGFTERLYRHRQAARRSQI